MIWIIVFSEGQVSLDYVETGSSWNLGTVLKTAIILKRFSIPKEQERVHSDLFYHRPFLSSMHKSESQGNDNSEIARDPHCPVHRSILLNKTTEHHPLHQKCSQLEEEVEAAATCKCGASNHQSQFETLAKIGRTEQGNRNSHSTTNIIGRGVSRRLLLNVYRLWLSVITL